MSPGYVRYGLPRSDLHVTIGDLTVPVPLALGAWAGFSGTGDSSLVMGDLVLTAAELARVLEALDREGIDVTAVHNHLVGETPTVTYVHFHGVGGCHRSGAASGRRRSALPARPARSLPHLRRSATIDTRTGVLHPGCAWTRQRGGGAGELRSWCATRSGSMALQCLRRLRTPARSTSRQVAPGKIRCDRGLRPAGRASSIR